MSFYKDYNDQEAPIVGSLNMALVNFVLRSLEIHGYRPKDVELGDEYFLFTHYPNSRDEFRLNRVWPGWRFGLWVYGEAFLDPEWDPDRPVVQLFCQHDSLVDKFKPSASELHVELLLDDFDSLMKNDYKTQFVSEPWPMRLVARFADQIRLHPVLSYNGMNDHWCLGDRLLPKTVKSLCRESYERHHDELAIDFWAKAADFMGRRAVKEPEFEDYHVSNWGLHSWPPVHLLVMPREGLSDDELGAACDRAFPHGMSFGKRADGGTILRVEVPVGGGYVITD